jgi:Tfp pilus assembly protein FimT
MTLIELLISLSIIAMMTLIAMPMLSSYQKRAALNNDVDSIVQLIEYARTLHNNPNQPQSNGYQIVITSDVNGASVVELYSLANPGVSIDSVKLSSYEEIESEVEDFIFDPRLKTPYDKLWNCNKGSYDCGNSVDIIVRIKNSDMQKTIRVFNTSDDFSQLFSIKVMDRNEL